MPEPKDYTVGWISAMEDELVAVSAFLDEEHSDPDHIPVNDDNSYTLGRIGQHNVVIAVMPHWQYGLVNAATVARDMVRSFPNVRIGLMVGIGGGAPSQKHDIRLGDVVVSSPSNRNGGVLQYDYGKTTQDQAFVDTGYLNQPPKFMLTAMANLKATYKRKGHRIQSAIDAVLEKNPRLQSEYQRPDGCTDRLYKPSFTHKGDDEANCKEVCGADESNLVSRVERSEHADNPTIHYGQVASANQLMQNAFLRDILSAEKDILCFEMEAAGLMNHFPCLVIRGICDYSDTHKNTEWQGYAAMTATVYAKELLSRIAPNKVEAEKRISDVLNSIEKHADETHRDVKNLVSEQLRRKVLHWLSPPDPSTNYNKGLQQRHKGTGFWFLQSDEFKIWKTQQNSFLWLYGIPGCGKTILSSTIIEHLRSLFIQSLLYFYFDFASNDKQTLESLVRSLINQLYHTHEGTQSPLDVLFSSCNDRQSQPSCESLCKVFLQMIKQAKEVWIILDALDECSTRKGSLTEGLISWIRDLVSSGQRNIHLLVTSRKEQDIYSGLNDLANEQSKICIQSDLVNGDISAYIHTKVREGEGLKRWRGHPNIQEEIEERLTRKANGMFRWVACQIDSLEHCLDYPRLRVALDSLPETLDTTYARIIKAIPASYKQTAFRLLQFLTFSERPLRIEEAVDAIAVDVSQSPYFSPKNRMPDPLEITCYCSSLVVISKNYNTEGQSGEYAELRLGHFSVKEFLMSTRSNNDVGQAFQSTTASASIAMVCVAYLLHFEKNLPLEEVRQSFPFAQYSARFWMNHARVAEGETQENVDLVKRLLCHQKCSYDLCYDLYRPDQPWDNEPERSKDKTASALYYMAFGGLQRAVVFLLDKGANVNAQGGWHGSALQASSSEGHEQIVKLLLKKGADVNVQGGFYGSALQASSSEGHEQIVKLLLKKGADVNAQGGFYGSALQASLFRGHEQIVKLLLDKGANLNAQGGFYGSALYIASSEGHEQIMKLLLDKGADINAWEYGNTLHAASSRGQEQIVKLLLNNSTDVNAREYGNALHAASSRGHEQIVKLLLDKGADVNAREYGNALQAASSEGHEQIVKLLLNNSADVNAREYSNALHAASSEGHEQIVKLLLDNSADVNAREYGNALCAASCNGYEQIVKLLLDNSADVNAREYGNALCAASCNGYEQIVKLLLDNSADVNAGEYSKALHAASCHGYEQIVKLLLDNSADVNAKEYSNALHAASSEGHEQIVKLLLNNGADINAREYSDTLRAASSEGHEQIVKLLLNNSADVNAGEYGNALHAASYGGHEQIVKLLLDKGVDVNAREYSNALQAASSEGHEQIVKLLLKNSADANAQGINYSKALQRASFEGHEQIVKLLLDKGADVNAGGYSNALQAASYRGHEQIVKLLLNKGADVNLQGEYYNNALQAASSKGHERIVKLLFKNGADANAQGGYYGNALQRASFGGHEQIVKLLLDKGADVNAGGYNNALQAASSEGHEQIVKLLLDKGADVNAQGEYYDNALQAASSEGHEQIVKLLLDKGADVNAQGEYYDNALQAASSEGHEQIVKLLLENGATSSL